MCTQSTHFKTPAHLINKNGVHIYLHFTEVKCVLIHLLIISLYFSIKSLLISFACFPPVSLMGLRAS